MFGGVYTVIGNGFGVIMNMSGAHMQQADILINTLHLVGRRSASSLLFLWC